jgi:hypothetical protein
MKFKRFSVDQRINGQRTLQQTKEVVPSSGKDHIYILLKKLCPGYSLTDVIAQSQLSALGLSQL